MEKGQDRYFLYDNDRFREIDSRELLDSTKYVVTHDYYLISTSLYRKHMRLPQMVVDISEFARFVHGKKKSKERTQEWEIAKAIKKYYHDKEKLKSYYKIFYRKIEMQEDVYMYFAHKMAEYTEELVEKAIERNEYNRYLELEIPLNNTLVSTVCKGLPVISKTVMDHKAEIEKRYYKQLKAFAIKHNLLFEVPNEGEIKEKLRELGYEVDTEEYGLDYLINHLPSVSGYTDDLRELQKTYKSYSILNLISSTKSRIHPYVETHATTTSRIYYKAPNVQNIAKRYRNIFNADTGKIITYVDFDQFEIGIMAALSGDSKMMKLYEDTDTYIALSNTIFGNKENRGFCKRLMLSYTYGMSLKNLLRSVEMAKGDDRQAKAFFAKFTQFEEWKQTLYDEYLTTGRIPTICSNYLNRTESGNLSRKEKRSVVSHVVQGTGSYIFKKAMCHLNEYEGVELLIPMHDAVLFQHPESWDNTIAVDVFESTMTTILEGKITGKASLEEFYIHV